jgi:fluoride exporter
MARRFCVFASLMVCVTAGCTMNAVPFMAYVWIALGGALGSVSRFWLNGIVSERFATFPAGTMLINVLGSFIIGVFGALTSADGRMGSVSRAFVTQLVMIGLCGGFTTFSSFSLQTFNLLREREWLYAGGNILLSVVACLGATALGFVIGSAFNSMKGS